MATRIIFRESSLNKKRPLLHSRSDTSAVAAHRKSCAGRCANLGEVCGKTIADCTAVCCCCPLGLGNVVFFVVYKVPAGLCRKALKNNRRRRMLKKGLLPPPGGRRQCRCHCDGTDLQIHPILCMEEVRSDSESSSSGSDSESEEAVLKLEKEMWDRFYGAGFWRSQSQKEPIICKDYA